MDDEKIIDLETRIAFQEQALNDLNDVICKQRDQVDQLEEVCRILAQRISELAGSSGAVGNSGQERPPHY